MPELPELQIIINQMKEELLHAYVTKVTISDTSLQKDLRDVSGQKIIDILRYGRYIYFQLSRDAFIVEQGPDAYFMLTEPKKRRAQGTRIAFLTEKGALSFVDEHMNGKVLFVKKDKTELPSIGVDPLTKRFNFKFLYAQLMRSNMTLKSFLTDQSIISGIGNMYAKRILHESELPARTKANSLGRVEARKLFWNIKTILRDAIVEAIPSFAGEEEE